MSEKKYILIDKDIIIEGREFSFDIYYPYNSGVKLLLAKNTLVEHKHIIITYKQKAFYVAEEAKALYKELHDTNLEKLSGEFASFEDKTTAIYSNATNVMNKIFENPETLANYDNSKAVVNDLVLTILDHEFTMLSLMNIATHDYYTHTHSLNVTIYTLSLGSYLGLDKERLSRLGESALLHDLGKSKVSADIINKNGKLTVAEFDEMKKHPEIGYQLALSIGVTDKQILSGIRHHHERMDGNGYPQQLKAGEISLFARIIGLCDIFDAITSKRSYKEAMHTFEALTLIKTKMHNHVDLKLLHEMIMMFKTPTV